nr:uncharacterized protein LOC106691865 [Halyomorpha halys]
MVKVKNTNEFLRGTHSDSGRSQPAPSLEEVSRGKKGGREGKTIKDKDSESVPGIYVQSILKLGASRTVESVLEQYNVDVVALQEIRWGDTEMVSLEKYLLINSGSKENRKGTGFMIKKSIRRTQLGYNCVNDRICGIRLKGRFCKISLISTHAQCEDAEEIDKEAFYNQLTKMYDEIAQYDTKIILGDFNAQLGKEEIYKPITGQQSRHDTTNDNDIRTVEFAASKDMRVTTTMFSHKNIHKET